MISKQHKCIYIHIPKTAGTSIEKKLGHFEILQHNVQDHRTYRELEIRANRMQRIKELGYVVKKGNFKRIVPVTSSLFYP